MVDVLRDNVTAASQPTAYVDEHGTWTWSDVDAISDAWAEQLISAGLHRDDRVAMLLPDGAPVHIGFYAAEKAGVIAVGIGSAPDTPRWPT